MRRIGGNVCEEWSISFFRTVNPFDRCVKENVGAKSMRLYETAVHSHNRIKVRILRHIRAAAFVGLTNPASTMNECMIKATLMWLIGFLITKMPFPKDRRLVSRLAQRLRQRHCVQR